MAVAPRRWHVFIAHTVASNSHRTKSGLAVGVVRRCGSSERPRIRWVRGAKPPKGRENFEKNCSKSRLSLQGQPSDGALCVNRGIIDAFDDAASRHRTRSGQRLT
jgi:hypothetical protein